MAQISYIFSGVGAASHARWLASAINTKSNHVNAYAAKIGILRYEVYILGEAQHVSVIKGVVDDYMRKFKDAQVYTQIYNVEREVDFNALKHCVALYFGDEQADEIKRPWFGNIKFDVQGSRAAHREFRNHYAKC